MKIRIILADDHKIIRDGLRSLLARYPEFEVVGEADNGRSAVALAGELAPDVVVMDIAMPDLNGVEATHQIVANQAGIKVIALSMYSDRRYVVEMLKAGATGYLLKESAFEELAIAIRDVTAGKTSLSPRIADMLIGDYVQSLHKEEATVFSILTPRERQVLQLLAEGNSTAQIAAHLEVSTKTVETYRQHIMNKLNIRSIAELTKYAIREGLTTL